MDNELLIAELSRIADALEARVQKNGLAEKVEARIAGIEGRRIMIAEKYVQLAVVAQQHRIAMEEKVEARSAAGEARLKAESEFGMRNPAQK